MFDIHPDVRCAETPPGAFSSDPTVFRAIVERVLATSMHVVARADEVAEPRACVPFQLLPETLAEPLVLSRDGEGILRALSNVCTHRANILIDAPCALVTIRCRYHGRRFALDGRMTHMPEFDEALDFPRESDHLKAAQLASWGPILFAGMPDAAPIDTREVDHRLAFLPLERAVFDAETSRDYDVPANFALYVDNYLEGFHIPFVHSALNATLDFGAYETHLLERGVLQIGIAREGEPCFDLPELHLDYGKRVAAFYFWLWPTTMINAYPWGLSINVVQPLAVDRTRVRFWSFVWDEALRERGAGKGLHQVELEDEQVVQSVQAGVRSRLYTRGRYSPTREASLHHFHRLIAHALREVR